MLKSGTLTKIVDNINKILPFREEVVLIKDFSENFQLQVIGNPDNTFTVNVNDIIFKSQPVIICVMSYIILTVTFDFTKNNSIKFYVDGKEVMSQEQSNEKIVITHPPTSYTIQNNKTNLTICTKWQDWRFRLAQKDIEINNDRKKKSVSTQLYELKRSIEALELNFKRFKDDESIFLYNTLPIIRALIFWKKGSKNYNPLLLRLAGYFNHNLIIYSLSFESRKSLNKKNSHSKFLFFDNASLYKKSDSQSPIDFQEWLSSTIITGDYCLSYKDIIEKASNTMSFNHFDSSIPIVIDDLQNKITLTKSMLYSITIQIVEITVNIGVDLLNKFYETEK